MRSKPAYLRGFSLDFPGIQPKEDENSPYEHAQVGHSGKLGWNFL